MSVINSTSSALVTLDPARVAEGRLSAQLWSGGLLLDDSDRTGVWPDSVQVPGGRLSFGLPTRSRVWLTFGLQPVGHRDEAWLKRGLPCS